MFNTKKKPRRLEVQRETLRSLENTALGKVQGGSEDSIRCPSFHRPHCFPPKMG